MTDVAIIQNWPKFRDFIIEFLQKYNINQRDITRLLISCEEIFTNICKYAYSHSKKAGNINIELAQNNNIVEVKFVDSGVKFDPTGIPIADVTMPVHERKIGGLGLYIVRKFVDNIQYKYLNNCNILILTKKINDLDNFKEE